MFRSFATWLSTTRTITMCARLSSPARSRQHLALSTLPPTPKGVFPEGFEEQRCPQGTLRSGALAKRGVTKSLARFSTLSDQQLADRLADVTMEASLTENALLVLNERVGNYSEVRVRSQFCE
jgi:hypothetical protein